MSKNLIKKILLTFLLLLTWSFIDVAAQNKSASNDPCRIIMVSRIDFVPEVLEMVHKSLRRRTRQNISLVYHPFKQKLDIEGDLRNSYLLIEKGFEDLYNLENFFPTDMALQLAWVLIAKKDFAAKIDQNNFNLAAFGEALKAQKGEASHTYPWFEALYTKDTLLNITSALDALPVATFTQNLHFWQQKNAIGVLCKAMEHGLLNPLSVEADQILATKVFLAADSVCFTSWVPIEVLSNETFLNDTFKSSVTMPFPSHNKAEQTPKISFSLWQRNGVEQIEFKDMDFADIVGYRFTQSDIDAYFEWLHNDFSPLYDRLIMGDY
jgi:hypothetical protein